ncbi:A/G-specific adenine glycosylase [Arcticibacter sp. MXS-1]|uniref:A/G-specific adenine glycosylase n=1 Tax=Arcticibacter sp. MXS-1 TaxID=3341726 RepID=UPI0035A85986
MHFIEEVIGWYEKNKRDLPWRNTRDPYHIWLSEIILQQTRVEQGMPYYYRFIERYPTVSDFAGAREEDILKLWQGLGYYSRGRNMHHTANMVMEDFEGVFPSKYEQLIGLRGIGEYTAAAISSFAANEARAVVDGNVFRLLSRYFGIDEVINSPRGKRVFTTLANEQIDKSRPGLSNQAMMEFGSLQCKPLSPACHTCPLIAGCYAYRERKVAELPVKAKKNRVRERYFNYIVAADDTGIWMNKRGPKDIWENLHDFPLFETSSPASPEDILASEGFKRSFGSSVTISSVHGPVVHILSHQKIYAQFIIIRNFTATTVDRTSWFPVKFEDLESLAQPKLIFAFLQMFPTLKA